jgi:phage tail-like protein
MGATPATVVQTVTHVSVAITGPSSVSGVSGSGAMNPLLFNSCDAPDWKIDAPKFTYHGNSGTPESVITSVQNPTYGAMTLKGGWDPGNTLAKWMNQISDPAQDYSAKIAQVTVQFMDSKGTVLFQWLGTGAIMTSFSHSGSDASSNGVLTVTATIEANKWELQNASGSPLT